MNPDQEEAQAVAVIGQRIIAVGSNDDVQKYVGDSTRTFDAKGQMVMPGFIEGHGHFSMMGKSLVNLNLLKSQSWQEIVEAVKERAESLPKGTWIEGRGWHQEKWNQPPDDAIGGYPTHYSLSEVSPDHPVVLIHASGHSVFANEQAMKIAGISKESLDPEGGMIRRGAGGEPIGVFEENAMSPVRDAYQAYLDQLPPEQLEAKWYQAIEFAQEECLRKGITSFQDAGTLYEENDRYKKMAEEGKFKVRLWSMLRHPYEEMKDNMEGLPIRNVGDGYYTCAAIKSEVDGALGSFGAWLLKSYADKQGFVGQNTTTIAEVERIASLALKHNMQLCVHAIGDRANREVLNIYGRTLTKSMPDHRWRIEHAQHLHPDDIPRFKDVGAIASMQAIHCTSDAPFVVKRLGEDRARNGAYVWRSLIDAGAVVTNGTDAPVEDVDPIPSYYASVTRKRADSGMEFFPENRMTRMEALKSYTTMNAYAAFEEADKGMLKPGMYGDMIVLSKDLLTCTDEEILETEVLFTIVGGEVRFEKG